MSDYLKSQLIERCELVDEELSLDETHLNYLGPELTLTGCRVILRCTARFVHINRLTMRDSKIEARKRLINFQDWCGAAIRQCKFTGYFCGNDFGHWPALTPDWQNGIVEDCDFSNAILDACRFMNCDIRSIALPKWPCFAIVSPLSKSEEIAAKDLPPRLNTWVQRFANELEITSAIVEYAPTVMKRYGCTEVELRNCLERFGAAIL